MVDLTWTMEQGFRVQVFHNCEKNFSSKSVMCDEIVDETGKVGISGEKSGLDGVRNEWLD